MNFIYKLKQIIKNNQLSLNNYVFFIFLVLLFTAALISIIGNIITFYPFNANIKWIFSIIVSILGFYLLSKDKFIETFKTIVFILVLLIVIIPAWFYGGGDNSITILYMLLMTVLTILMFEKSTIKWILVSSYSVFCIVLLIIVYKYPYLVEQSQNQNIFLDSVIQVSMIFVITSISVGIYTRHYSKQHRQLQLLNNKLEAMATIDFLSNVYTRRKIISLTEQHYNNANDFYIFMIDIDNFKFINDKYGHIIGDKIINYFSSHILNCLNGAGDVGRYGGDEFMIIISNKNQGEIEKFAYRLLNIPSYEGIEITMSGGVFKRTDSSTLHDVISGADFYLLEAKKSGRNQIKLCNGKAIIGNNK